MNRRPITAAEKAEIIRREIKARRSVYPGMVSSGHMYASEAERELAVLEAICEDYADEDLLGRLREALEFRAAA